MMDGSVAMLDFATSQRAPMPAPASVDGVVRDWVRSQAFNLETTARALAPFAQNAFGDGPAAPTPAQIDGANALIAELDARLSGFAAEVGRTGGDAVARARLAQTVKGRAHRTADAAEKIWNFYYEIFSQRQAFFADKLLAADRIAKDYYQAVYLNPGLVRRIPYPPALAYINTGFGAATFRRGVKLTALGRRPNPFPLVVMPPTRLSEPWTLGAIPHEVGHNIHSDLGLWTKIRRQVGQDLIRAGFSQGTAATFSRWSKEIVADLIGVLLIGPSYVRSLMDVVGNDWLRTSFFTTGAVHPTPLVRVPLNAVLVARLGFTAEGDALLAAWRAMYPPSLDGALPTPLAREFLRATDQVIETIVFTPYAELGGQSFAETTTFDAESQKMALEAAERLARGEATGILP
jgi:hypothetical protein